MKQFKKLVSVLCAISMILTMSVSAFAATSELDPEYVPERFVEPSEIALLQMAKMIEGESGKGDMKYNDGSGLTGEAMFAFEAKTSSVSFKIDWAAAQFGDTYHFQLYRVNGIGIPATKVDQARTSSFGATNTYTNLVVEANYYVVVSSMSVPKNGASVDWEYYFNE